MLVCELCLQQNGDFTYSWSNERHVNKLHEGNSSDKNIILFHPASEVLL